ncbi:hypothetical protein [Methylobacter sp.]|uniref:hypothetical protein n=1 Tax=Methylobacter sp. TaxID=2051955 RepID=UPI001222D680|nr:hypothetical protein [Methylobacter sp.]TAK62472.1 MAG: hypothetical protein EPO18_10525 [Methylobacter sp.]
MHIPEKRIYSEIRSEVAGIWFVPANYGEEIAVLIKAPTSTLKSLISGCSIGFAFGVKSNYLCCGARIYDISDAPVFTCNIQRHIEEHNALKRFLLERSSPLFLFNELDICVAWSNISISEELAKGAYALINPIEERYCGDFTPQTSLALDDFCFSIDSTQRYSSASKIETIEIAVEYGSWTSSNNSFIGNYESKEVIISEPDEGATLEKSVWAAMESVFPFGLHHSPCVRIGNKTRELTDVLTFYKYGSFLFEAKDLSVFNVGSDRSRERRTSSVKKQTKKAITQLVGASKAVKRGEKIISQSGDDIKIVTDKPFHCIVLLIELAHEGDWSEIEQQLKNAILETGDYFHVFDLQELIMLLKICRGEAELFDYNLIERCKSFFRCGSIHIRSRPAPENTGADCS